MAKKTPLALYLARHGISQGAVSREVGAARGVVSRWCSGKRVPDLKFAIALERFTGGEVPVSAWLAPVKPRRAVAPSPDDQRLR